MILKGVRSDMIDRSGSERPLEPDADRLWLSGEGAEIKISRTSDKRALDIVAALRKRYRERRLK